MRLMEPASAGFVIATNNASWDSGQQRLIFNPMTNPIGDFVAAT